MIDIRASDIATKPNANRTPRLRALPAACDFVIGESFEHRERVRENWTAIGYEYWTTRDLIEMWRHPVTGHVVELTTY